MYLNKKKKRKRIRDYHLKEEVGDCEWISMTSCSRWSRWECGFLPLSLSLSLGSGQLRRFFTYAASLNHKRGLLFHRLPKKIHIITICFRFIHDNVDGKTHIKLKKKTDLTVGVGWILASSLRCHRAHDYSSHHPPPVTEIPKEHIHKYTPSQKIYIYKKKYIPSRSVRDHATKY